MSDLHCFFFFSSRRRHTRCALVTGVQRVLFRSAVDQPQQALEGRMVDGHRLEELADMVDHHLAGQAADGRLVLRQVAAIKLHQHMPAEGMYARSEERRVGKEWVSTFRSRG